MRFEATGLNGAWLIHLEPVNDARGSFARTFCENEFQAHGLQTRFPQHSVSWSSRGGTVRGMHYQMDPRAEVKIVRCLSGSIWDVIIDIRPESATFGKWRGFELSEEDGRQLYVPKGFAHGFQSLTDDARVNYLISEFHAPSAASGFRYDDPAFGIRWPLPVTMISEKDLLWPRWPAAPVEQASPTP